MMPTVLLAQLRHFPQGGLHPRAANRITFRLPGSRVPASLREQADPALFFRFRYIEH